LPEVDGVGLPSPAAHGDPDGAGAFGGELKAAGGHRRQVCDLGDNRAESAMPQALLEAGEEGFLVARLDIDHTIGPKPDLGDGWSEEVLAGDAPQDLAARSGGDPSGKQSGGRAVDHPIAAAGDLM
jgi:hypothetical protein